MKIFQTLIDLKIVINVLCNFQYFMHERRISMVRAMDRKLKDPLFFLDVLSYNLFIMGLVARHFLSDESIILARRLFTLAFLSMYLKFFEVFFLCKDIGVKIIMIKAMVTIFSTSNWRL